jgi:hydrogenase-4 component F
VLFLSSGDISLRYQTREATRVSGLLAAVPVTGGALLLGSFAVLGSPPFGLFLSELTIVRAGFATSGATLPLLLLALLAVAFVAFARTATGMVTGGPPDESGSGAVLTAATPHSSPGQTRSSPYQGRWTGLAAAVPLVAGLVALLVLGLWIPAGLDAVIRHSAAVL